MIAKIIAYGRTREEALARLRRAMTETTVVIEGGACNKSFVLDLLAQPEVVDGTGGWADTGWIDRVRGEGRLVAQKHAGVAIVAAAIEAYVDELQIEVARLLETAHGGRPQAQHQAGRPVELKLRGTTYRVSTVNTGPSRYRVTVATGADEQTVDAGMDRIDEFHRRLVVGESRHHVVTATHGPSTLVEVDGVAHRISRDEGGVLRSPAPALVVATPARVGDEVEAGAPVVVLESMKMETVIYAPFAARVKELPVITGSQVETGAALVKLEPIGDGAEESAPGTGSGAALDLPAPAAGQPAAVRAARAREALTAVVLGYDVSPLDQGAALADYLAAREELRAEGVSVLADEMALLGTFADLAELSRNQPADEERHTELRVHSSREHFHTFLQSLDVERGGLPEQFRVRLLRVLRHYGVEDLDRTPALEESVFRIFLAQQRSAPEVALASAVLGRWIDEPPPTGELAGQARQLLERLGRATQLRFPVVGDLARSVRFRWFDQPPSTPSAPTCWPGSVTSSPRWPRTAACRTVPTGSRRWPRSRSRSSGSWPSGSRTAYRPGSRCWRCWRGATTASTTSTSSRRSSPTAGRSWSPTTPSTTGPPAWCRPSAPWPSWPTPRAGWPPPSGPTSRAVATTRRPWSTSTCTGPTHRTRRTPRARRSGPSSRRCRSPTTYGGCPSPSAPAPAGRSATTPSGPPTTARWPRTTSPAASTRWSVAA